jgi:hypothetical protein
MTVNIHGAAVMQNTKYSANNLLCCCFANVKGLAFCGNEPAWQINLSYSGYFPIRYIPWIKPFRRA